MFFKHVSIFIIGVLYISYLYLVKNVSVNYWLVLWRLLSCCVLNNFKRFNYSISLVHNECWFYHMFAYYHEILSNVLGDFVTYLLDKPQKICCKNESNELFKHSCVTTYLSKTTCNLTATFELQCSLHVSDI